MSGGRAPRLSEMDLCSSLVSLSVTREVWERRRGPRRPLRYTRPLSWPALRRVWRSDHNGATDRPVIDPSARVHETADLEPDVTVGPATSVWHRAQIRSGARLGA